VLLCSFPEDDIALVVFVDFNIHLEKPYAADFISLLASFELKRLITTGTHKSGNQLDLVYTRNCITDNILVKPLNASDHFLITFMQPECTFSVPSFLCCVIFSSLTSPITFLISGSEYCNRYFMLHSNLFLRKHLPSLHQASTRYYLQPLVI